MDLDWSTYVITDRAGHLVPIGHSPSRRDIIIALRKYAGLMCGSNTASMCAFMRQHKVVDLADVGKQYRRRQKGRNSKARRLTGKPRSRETVIELV